MKKQSATGGLHSAFFSKMHEFSVCQTLVTAVLKELGKVKGKPIRLKKARICAGQYHRLVPASLKLAYKILTKDTPAEGSSLLIKTVPVKLRCNKCGWTGLTRDIYFVCRKCGGVDLNITGGKELCLESIEVERRQAQRHRVTKFSQKRKDLQYFPTLCLCAFCLCA